MHAAVEMERLQEEQPPAVPSVVSLQEPANVSLLPVAFSVFAPTDVFIRHDDHLDPIIHTLGPVVAFAAAAATKTVTNSTSVRFSTDTRRLLLNSHVLFASFHDVFSAKYR